MESAIAQNLAAIRAKIAAKASAADPVVLVAVAKTYPASDVEAAIAAGQRVFGENRVQEAASKYPPLRVRHPDLALHLIGPLQTNKVRDALGLFDAIQTLDRPKLAAALAAEFSRNPARPALFVQVNTGEEPQKSGILPRDADAFLDQCRSLYKLDIAGLMCIPPVDEPPAPHFALLREIARRNAVAGLSMGMSGDFETAVALGATHVRVGSAVFGKRG